MKIKLSDAFELQMGKTPSRNSLQYWNGTHKWISIGDLSGAGKYINQTKECISDSGVAESGIRLVPKGTVIMSFKLSIGKTAITAEDMYTNEAIMAFIDKGIYPIDNDYIFHLFSGMDWSEGTNKAVLGATLNKATLSEKWIDIPNMEEQKYVVNVLDKLDSLISLRKQQLIKLDELVKARFVEMFGDLGTNSKKWLDTPLVTCCNDPNDIKCGPFGTQLSKSEYQAAGIPLWGIPQVNSYFRKPPVDYLSEEKAQQLIAYSLIPDDIVMSRKGNVGMCAIYPNHLGLGIIHSDVLRIRVNQKRFNPYFLMCQLHISPRIENQISVVSSGAIMAGINVSKLKGILVHEPPVEMQNKFAEFYKKIDSQKLTIQQSLDKLEMLKKALMQGYFG